MTGLREPTRLAARLLEKVVIIKLAIGVAAACLGLALVSWNRLYRISARQFMIESTALAFVTRVALFLAVFVVARQAPQSDVGVYYEWAHFRFSTETGVVESPAATSSASETGGVRFPYRDNNSCYAPLFTYATALPLKIYDHPISIVVLSMLIEIASVPIWLAAGRLAFGEHLARTGTLLTIGSGLAWYCSSALGVNQSWMALLTGLSVLLLLRFKPIASGIALGVSMVAVKFIGLVYVPAFFFSADRRARWRWVAAFGAITLAVYGGFSPFCDVLFPFRQLAGERSSGNIPFLLSAIGVPFETPVTSLSARIESLAAVAALGIVFLAALWRGAGRRPGDVIPWIALLLLTTMIGSRKSHAIYIAMATFPVCVAMAAYGGRYAAALLLGALGAIALPEGSLYFRAMHEGPGRVAVDFRALWSHGRADPLFFRYLLILALNVVQVGIYLVLAFASWRTLTSPPFDASNVSNEPIAPRPRPLAAAAH